MSVEDLVIHACSGTEDSLFSCVRMFETGEEETGEGCPLHGSCPRRIFDELNPRVDNFKVGIGGQKPNENPEVECICVPGKFRFGEGRERSSVE